MKIIISQNDILSGLLHFELVGLVDVVGLVVELLQPFEQFSHTVSHSGKIPDEKYSDTVYEY